MKDLQEKVTIPLVLLVLIGVATCFLFRDVQANSGNRSYSEPDRQFLVAMFEEKGFDQDLLKSVFYDKRLKKLPIIVSRNVHNKENRRNYEDFHSSYSLKIAHRFSRKWKSVLTRASQEFDVDEEVLVSILLVETGLGNILGRYPVISVFSSIIVEKEQKHLEAMNKIALSEDDQYVLKRLSRKAEWAEVELTALLTMVQDRGMSPFQLKGSFAGAFGIPQFLPSSYLKWGYDSDQNGSVNLFLFPDAIYSTANYLKAHGWKKGLYLESNKDVIYKYNNSEIYVETVLNVAKKIKELQSDKSKEIAKQTRFVQDYKSQQQEDKS
ncbi:lytic murein transglycosylase [bacterium]|nr:lytic murein transglycosylase [bacterium]